MPRRPALTTRLAWIIAAFIGISAIVSVDHHRANARTYLVSSTDERTIDALRDQNDEIEDAARERIEAARDRIEALREERRALRDERRAAHIRITIPEIEIDERS